jgi:competence protein ComEA
MFTKTEKGYLILTLGFLAAGSGIKAYRHAAIRLGPFKDVPQAAEKERPQAAEATAATVAGTASAASDSSLARPDAGPDSLIGPGVSDSSSGIPDPETASPASAKASEPNKTARSGANKSAFTGKIDLNRAEASELSRLNGVGAKTAQAIVDYRRAHGPYRNFRDLLQIKGIGEKKLEKLMPNLILLHCFDLYFI